MTKYAANTEVSTDRSKIEIEHILQRYGAEAFMHGWDKSQAVIAFKMNGRQYRISLPLPPADDFIRTEKGRRRTSQNSIQAAFEQATRQRWRALALYIKAVLEAAEAGITSVDQALQPFIMLPNGMTVGEWMEPQIETVYLTGKMPPLLPSGSVD